MSIWLFQVNDMNRGDLVVAVSGEQRGTGGDFDMAFQMNNIEPVVMYPGMTWR